MGVLADISKLTADSTQAATDAAAVVTAQSALTAAQAKVTADNATQTADDQALVTDLTAAGGSAYVTDPSSTTTPPGILVYTVNTTSPVGYTITSVPAAT